MKTSIIFMILLALGICTSVQASCAEKTNVVRIQNTNNNINTHLQVAHYNSRGYHWCHHHPRACHRSWCQRHPGKCRENRCYRARVCHRHHHAQA